MRKFTCSLSSSRNRLWITCDNSMIMNHGILGGFFKRHPVTVLRRHSLYKLLSVLYLISDIKFMNVIIKATNFDVISFLHYMLQQCVYNQCLQITYLWLQNVFYLMCFDFEPSNIQNPHVVSGFKETHSSWFMVCFLINVSKNRTIHESV